MPKETGELFDGRVDDYDLFVRATVIGYDEIRESIADIVKLHFPPDSGPRVLDLGIGTGNTSVTILEACPSAKVVGYDLSQKMVERVRDRLSRFDISTICGDVADIDYQGEFDLAVSSIVYHHLDDARKKQGYKRVFDALKEGGLFILADVMVSNNSDLNRLMTERWARLMEERRGPEFRDGILELDDQHHQYATLNDNLTYLQRQGFRTEVYWRKMNSAVICAFR